MVSNAVQRINWRPLKLLANHLPVQKLFELQNQYLHNVEDT